MQAFRNWDAHGDGGIWVVFWGALWNGFGKQCVWLVVGRQVDTIHVFWVAKLGVDLQAPACLIFQTLF